MGNPQLENGHTDTANELVDQFMKLHLSGNEWQILWTVLRKTYGWHKKEDTISLTQFQKLTDLSRPSVKEAIDKLVGKNILVLKKVPPVNIYRFNKEYTTWIISDSKKRVNRFGKPALLAPESTEETGRVCSLCGFKEVWWKSHADDGKQLQQHHLSFTHEGYRPKSDKSSETILICFVCHRNIHSDAKDKLVPKKELVPKSISNQPKKVPELVPKKEHTKESKETNTKESILSKDNIHAKRERDVNIDFILTAFYDYAGHRPLDRQPRNIAQVFKRQIQKLIKDLAPYKALTFEDIVRNSFSWYSRENDGVQAKYLNTVRKNITEILFESTRRKYITNST